ncbi:MAG: hypothetical protein AAGG45_02800 [Pseudomonadota bacterium]
MSKAREIAEERFAKGEITKTEFDEIISSLSPEPQPVKAMTGPGPIPGEPDTETTLAADVDIKAIDELRTGLHYVGGFIAILATAVLATLIFRWGMSGDDISETTSVLDAFGLNSWSRFITTLVAGFSLWIASFIAVGVISMVIKTQVVKEVNKTPKPQDTLAELARRDAKRDDNFREQHIIHAMPGEAGDVSENQYQTKIRNGGAFLGAILVFAGLNALLSAL